MTTRRRLALALLLVAVCPSTTPHTINRPSGRRPAAASAGGRPCVQSGDGAAGLSLCFTGPQVSVSSADNYALANHTAGFSLLVHNDNPEPKLLNANNLLQNANFSQVDSEGELIDWGAVGLGMYTRTSDPAHTRPGGPGTAVIVNNSNGSVAGFEQQWAPATPAQAASRTLAIGGWSKLVSGAAPAKTGDYSLYLDILYTDGSNMPGSGSHSSFPLTAGSGWQYSLSTVDLGGKNISHISIYGLCRGFVGVAIFSELYFGVPPAGAEPTPFTQGSATPGDAGSVSISSTLKPPGWRETIGLGAVFTNHHDHIRCDGSIATTPAAGQADPGDKAVSIRFSLPLDASGWEVFADADHSQLVPAESSAAFQGFGLSPLGNLPGALSRAPLFVIADSKKAGGLLAAFPMENTVWVNRVVYNAATRSVDIEYDFGLTAQSAHFPAMATFSFLLAWVQGAAEPFRAGLQRFYDIHPQIFAIENQIREQGAWIDSPIDDFHSIPDVEDFGLKFHEGGTDGNVTESKYMNQLEIDILPYIEPGMMHWSLPKGMACTYENLNRTIHECVNHPEKYPSQATLCQQIVADAMVDKTGRWIFNPEDAAWNDGAVFFTNLQMDTVGSGPESSRAADSLRIVQYVK